MKVLIVEDTPRLREAAARALQREGMVVETAADGPTGLWAAREARPDVLVLDVGLPGFDGFELLARLRAEGIPTPALMLTAMSDLAHRLQGFDVGADDYVVKPIDMLELVARVRALARRGGQGEQAAVIQLDDLEIDFARAEVRRDGVPLPMRRRERRLLEILARERGRMVGRRQLELKMYNGETEVCSNSIEAAISLLRRWIDRPGEPSRVTTLRGEGYRLER
jgi:DNA-binding response OmpR family regulator